jgi:probable F420-dependent oxidoreductase
MRIGITTFVTDYSIEVVTLARAVEERGFASLWLAEHTHIPSSRLTPAPTGDAELGKAYSHLTDPLISLAAAAAVTSTITLGTGVALVAQHDPIVMAKQISTLDAVSAGRFVLGIGFGWNREEMASHGIDYAARRDVVREKVLLMKALWRDDEASFHGEHVNLEPSWQWPKPVARDVPVLIGGAAGPKLFAAICDYGDGWIPIGGAGLSSALPQLRAQFEAAGRDPSTLQCVPFGSIPDKGKLDHYRELGITEVVLRLNEGSTDDVLRRLDRAAATLG